MFVQSCTLPPALHPSDSIKSDRWSQPVQDSEHERLVSPPSFLQIIKLRIVSQNKCPKLRRLNVAGCWAHTGLTFPAESIPSLTAPLHPGSETKSSASSQCLPFRCDAYNNDPHPCSDIHTSPPLCCKQMLRTTRYKLQTDLSVNLRGSTRDCGTKKYKKESCWKSVFLR